jgi:hypothetical protein
MLAAAHPPPLSPLTLAWRHSGIFWIQTWWVIEHHPIAVLLCACPPAALRAYILLRGRSLSQGLVALLEIAVTLWRVLLLGVAIWAATSGREWHQLRVRVGVMAAWQIALSRLGVHLAQHLRLVLWELLFFALAFLILHRLMVWAVRSMARNNEWQHDARHRAALKSILSNMILAPLLVIYLVELARPALQ